MTAQQLAGQTVVNGIGMSNTALFDSIGGSAVNTLTAGSNQNGLMVALGATNFAPSSNTTTAQLGAGATFTGTVENVFNEPNISIDLTCDQAGTLTIYQYSDAAGSFQCGSPIVVTTTTSGLCRSWVINGNYAKVTFTNNGASATTTLNLNIAYGTIPPATVSGNLAIGIQDVNGAAISLGQKTAANSFPVTLASDNGITQSAVSPGTTTAPAAIVVQAGKSTDATPVYNAIPLSPGSLASHSCNSGASTVTVAAASAANTVIKNAPGILMRIAVTTAGTSAFAAYDNATTNSGTVLFQSAAVNAVGTVYDIEMPAANGITIANTANGPGLTVSKY